MRKHPAVAMASPAITHTVSHRGPRPVQAALYSAVSFTAGAVLPIAAFLLVPASARTAAVMVSALLALVILGMAGTRAGGAPMLRAAVRVGVGGELAMAITFGVGHVVGGIGA